VAGAERVELEGLVSPLDDLMGGGVELLRRALDAVPAVGVGLHAVAHRPAEEVVDRLIQRLADDVPAGGLEGGDPRAHHLPCAREVVAAHLFDELLDPEGVMADDVPRAGLGQVAHKGVGVVHHPRLAEAREALIRVEPHDRQVAPVGADDEGLHVRDLHALTSLSAAGIPGKDAPFSVVFASG
jgi:hypothetical protein